MMQKHPSNMNISRMTDQILSKTAGTAQRAGDWETAVAAFTELVRRNPRLAKAWVCLGSSNAKLGFTEVAIEQVKRGLTFQPNVSPFRSLLADLLFITGRCDSSLAQAKQAVALNEENWEAHELIARNLERIGRLEEGLTHLRILQETLENTGNIMDGALLNVTAGLLIVKKKYSRAQQLYNQAIIQNPNQPDIQRTAYNGLGRALDHSKSYEKAFIAFNKCAELTKQSVDAKKFNIRRALERINQNQIIFTEKLLHHKNKHTVDKHNNEINHKSSPVFLVGFPRSGTTLAEQILAAHPEIVTTGERPIIETMGRQWSNNAGTHLTLHQLVNKLDEQTTLRLRQWYWQAVSGLLGSNWQESNINKTLIDKQPMNITELGLIQLIFPHAKIIVMIRDPRDVCLSCYFQDFRLNESTACFLDLENTATYYAAVMNWYIQLRDRLTIPVMEVHYENIVNHFEQTTRQISDFTNLTWDESILRFHEKTKYRAVTTPSAAAVREPVSNKSIARWRNYPKHFSQPVTDILQPFITRWGWQ